MAEPLQLTAHIVVDFGGDDTAQALVEVDDREDGYNQGVTSFLPGAHAYLLLFHPDDYEVSGLYASAGSLAYVTDTFKEVEETLPFPNTDEASLRYPYTSNLQYSWIGGSLGVIAPSGTNKLRLPPRTFDTVLKKVVPEVRVGVARVVYNSKCKVYRLENVPNNVSDVLALFVLRKK